MSDALITTSTLSNTVTAALDQYIRSELRHQPMFRTMADTRPVQVDRPGSSVALYIHGDIAPATTPLSESVDPDFVALPNPTNVTLTPYEYGNATLATTKVRVQSFADVDPYQRDQVMWNMMDTLDELVKVPLNGGTNVRYSGSGNAATADVTDTDVVTTGDVRYIITKLRGNAAKGKRGDYYGSIIHPDVSHDLRKETGEGGWIDLHKYAAPTVFWPGEIGTYQGAFFIESARAKVATDGTSSAHVYRTLFLGREALAEGVQIEPEVRIGVVPDRLNRFRPLGWYGFLGWCRFREKALYRLESGSSMNT